jgi:hypothetical protein
MHLKSSIWPEQFGQGNLLRERRTRNAEFSEPDEVNIFCLNPKSDLHGGSVAGPFGLRQRKGADCQEILMQPNSGRR